MVNHCNKEVCIRLLRHGSKITARRTGKLTFILLKPFSPLSSHIFYANNGLLERNYPANDNVTSSIAENKDKLLTGAELQMGNEWDKT